MSSGWTIEDLLELHDLAQIDLAELLGCHFSTISGWVNGRSLSPQAYEQVKELFGLKDHELDVTVSERRGRQIGGSQPPLPPQKPETIMKRRGQKRTQESIDRMTRGMQIRGRRTTTVTITTEEWFD